MARIAYIYENFVPTWPALWIDDKTYQSQLWGILTSTSPFVELVFVIFAAAMRLSSVPASCLVSVRTTPSSVDTLNFQRALCDFYTWLLTSIWEQEKRMQYRLDGHERMMTLTTPTSMSRKSNESTKWQKTPIPHCVICHCVYFLVCFR